VEVGLIIKRQKLTGRSQTAHQNSYKKQLAHMGRAIDM
jgi:hypothetical protein